MILLYHNNKHKYFENQNANAAWDAFVAEVNDAEDRIFQTDLHFRDFANWNKLEDEFDEYGETSFVYTNSTGTVRENVELMREEENKWGW